ncbi:MAG: hypothetical protein QMD22_01680 [archaeon]|nr:hypothetical protein [archaeon]
MGESGSEEIGFQGRSPVEHKLKLKKGARVIEINRDETVLTPYVTVSLRGKAAEILPRLWKEFMEKVDE